MIKKKLLDWDVNNNGRLMPWKAIKDPYKIWISEIILQQTRVEQGTDYYNKLIKKYPTITDLANANEQELFSLWQGLGYYSRCKNLLSTAKYIVNELNGIFPKTYTEILKLKGIGEYTASAISSFAYNLPHAVVDGNVVRVLSRVFALKENYYSTSGKKFFIEFANQLIDKKSPSKYNQAIMDLGATICKPQNPICSECPFNSICEAKKNNVIADFPIKKEKLLLKHRHFHFLVIEDKNHIFITKRTEKDIWQNLHSFYLIESTNSEFPSNFSPLKIKKKQEENVQLFTQVLSHQKIFGYFYKVNSKDFSSGLLSSMLKINKNDIKLYGFPRLIISFFQKNNYL